MSKDGKTKDIFFGIVAIATLIVAIIGATLAYFSITASSNEGVVNATAAVVSIEYKDGQQVTAQADQLVPAVFETVVKNSYETYIRDKEYQEGMNASTNLCIDSNGRQVCSSYRFTVTSDIERTITASLNSEHNGFTYLSYALYDVTNKKWFELEDGGVYHRPISQCDNSSENTCLDLEALNKTYTEIAVNSVFGKTIDPKTGYPVNKGVEVSAITQEFDLILFIRETHENQNIDQGKQYKGTIMVDVSTVDKNGIISGEWE